LGTRSIVLDGQTWKDAFVKPGGPLGALGCLPPAAYLGVRVSLFVVWLACVLWSMEEWLAAARGFGYYFTKLTHWSAILELLYFFFAAFSTYRAIYGSEPVDVKPWFVYPTWILGATVPVSSLLVVLLFWLLVYEGGTVEAITVVMHGGNLVLVVVDILLNRQPFYLQYFYIPMVFSATYALFTLIYYLAGGTFEDGVSRYIYSAIDWSDPAGTSTILSLIVLLGVPFAYLAFYLVVSARIACRRQLTEDLENGKSEVK